MRICSVCKRGVYEYLRQVWTAVIDAKPRAYSSRNMCTRCYTKDYLKRRKEKETQLGQLPAAGQKCDQCEAPMNYVSTTGSCRSCVMRSRMTEIWSKRRSSAAQPSGESNGATAAAAAAYENSATVANGERGGPSDANDAQSESVSLTQFGARRRLIAVVSSKCF